MSEDYKMFFIEKYNEIGQLFLRLADYKNDPKADIDTEFIWQLIDVIDKCKTVAEAYCRDGGIHNGYALEKLQSAKSILDNSIEFFSKKSNKD